MDKNINKTVTIDDKEINYMIQIPTRIFKDIQERKANTIDFTVLGCVLGLVKDGKYDTNNNEFISKKTKIEEAKLLKSIDKLKSRGYFNQIDFIN